MTWGCTILLLASLTQSYGAGTWTALANSAPDNIDTALLLTDGSVMAASGTPNNGNIGNAWYKLTPDIHGSYVNGTWSTRAPMHDARLYYSSQVLKDGRVFVAGGEYGSSGIHSANSHTAEIYDPVANAWTDLPNSGEDFYDSNSEILPNGNVLVSPVFPTRAGGTIIYNPTLNSWSPGGRLFRGFYQDEATWVKLPDDSILTVDPFGVNSERYIPASNQWVNDGVVPVNLYDPFLFELGAGFLMADGRAIYFGSTGHTAIYTPSGTTSPGSWAAGPDFPNAMGMPDAPAAMMVNGKILCVVSPAPTTNNFTQPTSFYEYDPVANAFTSVTGPTGQTQPGPSYINRLLVLPDGNLLLSSSSQQLYVYTPDSTPLAAGKPTIASITLNGNGSYHLTGTLLNGISEGGCYGDDVQVNSNYPLIRLTDANGNVYYARTFNRSSTGVMTGPAILSTDFSLPNNIPSGTYSLVVVANGNSSSAVSFNGQVGPDLEMVTNTVFGGNGNGSVDPNECNSLSIILTNSGALPAANISATLTTTNAGVIVTVKSSGYPDLPLGAVGTNNVAFQFSTTPGFACGTPVNFTLTIKTDQGNLTRTFTVASGAVGNPLRYDSTNSVLIPDLSSGDSTILVKNFSTAVLKATVSLHITHAFDSDLLLELISPDGITNILAANVGGPGQNFGTSCDDSSRTIFSDDAPLNINVGAAPFTGSYIPVQPFSVFIGKSGTNINGTWHLHAVDQSAFDSGAIECWSLFLTPPVCLDGGGECPGSDLSIGGSVAPEPLVIGGNLVYTIYVTNNGPRVATGVSLTQTLPASADFLGATISQGNISYSGGTVSGNMGNLAVGGVVTATVTVRPNQSGTFNSTAAVAAVSDPDYDLSNNSILFTSHVNPPTADLAIGVVGTPNPVLVGGTVTYTISVTNNGPSTATGLTISNALSATLAVTSANPQGSATILGNTVIFNLGSLSPGAVTTATITAIPSALGQAVMTSTVRANQVDSISGNNTATAIISVSPSADLAVGFQSVPGSIVLGNVLNYTVSATNLGPSIATGVFISQTLPANAVVNSSSSSPGTTLSQAGSLITCNVGTLGVGGIVTINVQVAIATNEIATSTATISGAVADANLANNSATVNTVVAPPFVSIQAAGLLLLAENFAPANGAVDPGETVTVQFYLKNIGNVSTTNLTATLLATGGVTAPSVGAKNYTLSPGGFPDSKPFSFTASGTNGGSLTATLQLTNNGAFFTNVSFVFAFPKVTTFANTNVIVIPDSGIASPYPSTITVSGVTGLVGKVTATLSKFNHTYPHDVSVLLVSPTGARTLLMSHTADLGSSEADVNFTFDDSAPAPLPSSGSAGSGSWQPSGYAPTPVFPSPAPTNGYGSAMSVFNSTNPNGTWSLFVLDDSAGDQGAISNGWSLAISTISAINQVADLSLASVSSAGQLKAGSSLTNTFTITNNSTNLVNTLTFTSALATNVSVTISSVTVAQGNYTLTGGNVVASITNLNAGASATVMEVMTPNAAGSITNTASVSAALIDLVPGNNTNYITASVTNAVADVSIATTASAGTVVTGSNLVYTISVTNLGPDAALSVVITNVLPAGLSAVSQSFGTLAGNTLTCPLGNLAAGAGAVITVSAHAPTTAGTIINSATVTASSTDANTANNLATVSTVVRAPAALIGAISARLLSENFTPANGTVDAGETVTVSLSLANTGEIDTTNLVATLRHTGGVTSPSGPVNYGAVIRNGPAVSGTFTFTASVGASGSVTATLGLQDGSAFLGTVEFTFLLPQTSAFANTNAIIIPDHGIAAPYPATITVAGLTGLVSKVTVTLNGVTHSFPRDIGVLLVGPTGAKSVVMSGVGGGNSITNLTLTFDDAAATTLTTSAPLISAVAQPVSFPASRTFSSPAPSGNATALLSQLNGGNPNGVWSLYVVDDVAGDGGNISYGWSLALTTVSPLNPTADLFITASVSTNQINVGSQLTYTLRVTNQGPATVTGVVVTNLLPAGAALGTVTFSSGGTYTANAGAVVCNLNNLAVGAGAVVTIVATPTVAGLATDAASVTASETDLNSANNFASTSVTVVSITPARLSGVIHKPNGQFQFTLTGQTNLNYVIQASTNLTTGNWVAISTNTAVNGTFQFVDTNAPGLPQRFYRAVLAP